MIGVLILGNTGVGVRAEVGDPVVTITSPVGGSISVSYVNESSAITPVITGDSVPNGTELTITATPTSGSDYVLQAISFGETEHPMTSGQNSITETVSADVTVSARFAKEPPTIDRTLTIQRPADTSLGTFSVFAGTTNITQSSVTFTEDTVVTVKVKPNSGYKAVIQVTGEDDFVSNEPVEVTHRIVISKTTKITIQFEVATYTMNITPPDLSNGTFSVIKSVGGGVVNNGDSLPYDTKVTVTLTPKTGYSALLTIDGIQTTSATTISKSLTVRKDTTISAAFTQIILYKVTVTSPASSSGSIKVYSGNTELKAPFEVAKGTLLKVVATPANGFDFTSLTINGYESNTSSISYSIDQDITVSAKFTAYEAYKIKVVKNDGGTVSPSEDTILVRKGTRQSFTVIANSDCRIQSVNFTGSGLTVDGSTYTTGLVTRDETLTVKFVSKAEGVKDISVTPGGGVIVTVKSLENVAEQISGNIGNTIKVAMDKSTVITKDVLDALQGNNVNVLLDMKTYTWRINGQSIAYRLNSSINLGVNPKASSIDSTYMSRFNNFEDKTQLDLTYSGSFPFVGYLTIAAPGKDPVGKYASLFYFNETKKTFEALDYERVADDGTATFRFTHASKYVVVVSDRVLYEKDLSVGAGIMDVSQSMVLKTSDIVFASILLIGVAAGGIVLSVIVRKQK